MERFCQSIYSRLSPTAHFSILHSSPRYTEKVFWSLRIPPQSNINSSSTTTNTCNPQPVHRTLQMASDSSSTAFTASTLLSTFTLCPKLAPELRILIWKACLQTEVRIVRIQGYKWDDDYMNPDSFYKRRVLHAVNKTPGLLHANRESRAEAVKVYLPVFGTRLRHPVWFNFSRDFLIFDGRYPEWQFELFMNVGRETSSVKSEPERQMLHAKLRNLVLCNYPTYAARRELDEFCNLDNLILPNTGSGTMLNSQIQWARKKVGENNSEDFLSNMDTPSEAKIHQALEYLYRLRKLAISKGLKPTDTKIQCWYREEGVLSVGVYKGNSSIRKIYWGDREQLVKDEALTKMLKDCKAPRSLANNRRA